MITLNNISKTYHHQGQTIHALNEINLHVKPAEIFGIIGRSGAGKSTLIRCVNLLERPDQGQIIINQQDLMTLTSAELQQARRQMGMIFQHFNLLSNRTVYENVALPLMLMGENKKTIAQKVNELLSLVGLSDKKNVYPAKLSGGQKQRVSIARALITNPKILLCDEATSALDPETTLSILDLLKMIHREFGLSILLITHEMEVIKEIAHKVAVIDQGKIIEENEVVNLFTKPQHSITQQLVKSTLPQHLPRDFERKILSTAFDNSAVVLRLSFHRNASNEPAMTDLIRQFHLTVSILQGNIEVIQKETIGVLFVEVWTDQQNRDEILQQAIIHLNAKNIETQVIGYVDRNH
jgi:D-methionine transport system ATP-binding protein